MAQGKWRSWVIAFALGGMAAGLALWGRGDDARPMGTSPAAVAAPSPAAPSPTPSTTTESAAAPPQRSGPQDEAQALALAQFEAHWCSTGRQAHQQQMASLEQSFGGRRRMAMLKAAAHLPFNRFQGEIQRRVVGGWVATLGRSADPRDRATALFLRATEHQLFQEADADPVQAFEALAAQTVDPYVLHLWRRQDRKCLGGDGCTLLPLERWSQIDPHNAAAWLPLDLLGPDMTDARWQGLAQAQTLRLHHLDLQARLLALVRNTAPGLELEIALNHIARYGELERPGLALETACKRFNLLAAQRETCLRAAELVWSQPRPAIFDRDMAVLVVKSLGDLDERWRARAAEMAVLDPLDAEDLRAMTADAPDKAPDCSGLAPRRQRMQAWAEEGTWAVFLRELGARPRP